MTKRVQISMIGFVAFLGSSLNAQTMDQAIALEKQGNLAAATEVWKALVQLNPYDAALSAQLGVTLLKQHRYSEAASSFRKAQALDSQLQGVQWDLGLAEYYQRHFQLAAEAFKGTLAVEPQNTAARRWLGLSYYWSKQFRLAVETLGPLARTDPSDVELHEALAQSCLGVQDQACTRAEYQVIMRHSPDSVQAHVLSGEGLDQAGKTHEAVLEFEKAETLAPRDERIHFALGYLNWKLKNLDTARKELTRAIAENPDDFQALAYLGDVAWKSNDAAVALPLLYRAVKTGQHVRIAYLDLGSIYMRQEKFQEARAVLTKAVQLDPSQGDAHYQLGRVYQILGDTAAAEHEFNAVSQLYRDSDEAAAKVMTSHSQ